MSGSSLNVQGWFLAIPLMSVVYDVVSVGALRAWMKEPPQQSDGALEPLSFFRPVKRGVPDLRGKLEMLLSTTRPQDQIILGVDPDSPEETVCEEIRQVHPARAVVVVRCAGGQAVNPKISKLVQMEPAAAHPAWLLSDSEIILPEGFLDRFRREWQARDCAALTAGYRFVNLYSWSQRCDALHALLALWPGVAMVRRYGRVNFTLGACTLFRRDALAAVGGWKSFGADLGEDQRIGAALVKEGQWVHLSRHVATLDSDAMSWRDYWRHQRRVAVTYRAGSTAGFAGMAVTYGPVWALLGFLICPTPLFGVAFLVTYLFRAWRVWRTMRLVDFAVPGMLGMLGVVSVVEALCWARSWFPTRVWWSGRWWRVDFRGQLSRQAETTESPR